LRSYIFSTSKKAFCRAVSPPASFGTCAGFFLRPPSQTDNHAQQTRAITVTANHLPTIVEKQKSGWLIDSCPGYQSRTKEASKQPHRCLKHVVYGVRERTSCRCAKACCCVFIAKLEVVSWVCFCSAARRRWLGIATGKKKVNCAEFEVCIMWVRWKARTINIHAAKT
jgi:hypothetical protein